MEATEIGASGQAEGRPVAREMGAGGIFGGMTRDAYLRVRIHKRLHSDAEKLTDEELLELGRANFNLQFQQIQEMTSIAAAQDSFGIFGNESREQFLAKRIHKKLYGQAEALSDQELFDLSKLSFNEQFAHFGLPTFR